MNAAIEPELTLTRYAYAPEVTMGAGSDQPTTASFIYRTSPVNVKGEGRMTRLSFNPVLDFRFREHELGLTWDGTGGVEFGLIELGYSELIGRFVELGRVRSRSDGSVAEKDLRHYRLAFDDHGIYDIVCTQVRVDVIT